MIEKYETELMGETPILTPEKPKWIIFSEGGIGKSYLAASLPNTLYIDIEKIMSNLLKKMLIQNKSKNYSAKIFKQVLSQLILLSSIEHKFSNVVIDSISDLAISKAQFDRSAILKKNRIEDGDIPYNKHMNNSKWLTYEVSRLIRRLDMCSFVLAHEKDLYGRFWKEDKWVNEVVGKTFDASDKLGYGIENVGRLTREGSKIILHIIKGRDEAIFGVKQIDVTAGGYKAFSQYYGEEVFHAKVNAIPLCTEIQLTKLDELIYETRTKNEEVIEWLILSESNKLSDMPASTAESLIMMLENRLEQIKLNPSMIAEDKPKKKRKSAEAIMIDLSKMKGDDSNSTLNHTA